MLTAEVKLPNDPAIPLMGVCPQAKKLCPFMQATTKLPPVHIIRTVRLSISNERRAAGLREWRGWHLNSLTYHSPPDWLVTTELEAGSIVLLCRIVFHFYLSEIQI